MSATVKATLIGLVLAFVLWFLVYGAGIMIDWMTPHVL